MHSARVRRAVEAAARGLTAISGWVAIVVPVAVSAVAAQWLVAATSAVAPGEEEPGFVTAVGLAAVTRLVVVAVDRVAAAVDPMLVTVDPVVLVLVVVLVVLVAVDPAAATAA